MQTADIMLPRPLAQRPRIFVAEDDLATRALLRASLTRAAYDVTEVDNGTDALAGITRQPPDVALLDIGMPGRMQRRTMMQRHDDCCCDQHCCGCADE